MRDRLKKLAIPPQAHRGHRAGSERITLERVDFRIFRY